VNIWLYRQYQHELWLQREINAQAAFLAKKDRQEKERIQREEEEVLYFHLVLLVGQQEGHLACKKTEWWCADVVICLA